LFLTSALDESEWSASRPSHFIFGKMVPGIHRTGGWLGLTAGLDAIEKRKMPCLYQESNPSSSAVHPLAYRYSD
jgi:hypothetical protein